MAFALEIQMIPTIKAHINTLLNNLTLDTTAIAEELPVNHRIVDLAFATMQADAKVLNNNEYKKAFNKLNMQQLDVLSIFLEQRRISIQKLSKHLRMKPTKIQDQYLKKFIELELIEKVSKYTYCSTEWASFTPLKIVAVEAKLTNWQEALGQAAYNLSFADFSYVAMDQRINSKPEVVQKFIQLNVGLISVNDNEEINILHQPTKNINFKQKDFRLQRLRLCRDLICRNSKWNLVE